MSLSRMKGISESIRKVVPGDKVPQAAEPRWGRTAGTATVGRRRPLLGLYGLQAAEAEQETLRWLGMLPMFME